MQVPMHYLSCIMVGCATGAGLLRKRAAYIRTGRALRWQVLACETLPTVRGGDTFTHLRSGGGPVERSGLRWDHACHISEDPADSGGMVQPTTGH